MPAGRGCGLAIGPPAVMSLEAANGRACLGNSTLALATRGRRRASFNQTAASPDGLIKARIDLDLVGTLAGFPPDRAASATDVAEDLFKANRYILPGTS
jgi:hypothetical protein